MIKKHISSKHNPVSLFDRGSDGSAENPNLGKESKSFTGRTGACRKSLRSWYIRGTDHESKFIRSFDTLHDLSDLGSLILIQINPEERILKFCQSLILALG